MNKKKLIFLSHERFAEEYIRDSIIPSKINKFDLITNKNNIKILKLLKNHKIECNIHVVKNLTKKLFLNNFNIKNSLLISAGSPWIIKNDIIKLFKKNILNVHQSPLPSFKGAVASYVKLFEIRALQTCLHVVKEKVDQGEIVFRQDIFISKEHDNPYKINILLQNSNRKMLKEFLISYFIKKKKINYDKQNEFFGSYMPRLKTNLNGWVDWSLNVYELERFIGAFDEPYPGARTMIHGQEVALKDVQLSCMEPSRHSFENGMVLRKFLDMIVVSVNGGSIYIKRIMAKNKNIIGKIIPGDIFYTKLEKLDMGKRKNIYVGEDKKIYSKKINIKRF
jgi:methionyl-tRNA formyltransferase